MNIHEQALEIVARYKKSESELIDIIQQIDQLKAYREKGCTSSFDYCVKFLKLSESTSYDFINVARKAKEVPELKQAIDENLITVSKARRIASVISTENSSHWIDLARNLSKEKLQKEVATVRPELAIEEKVKYVAAQRLKLELGVSEDFMALLKKAQDLLSQKTASHVNMEAALEHVLGEFVHKHDPVEKAKRALNTFPKRNSEGINTHAKLGPGQVPFQRAYIPAQLKHQIALRDGNQRTHVSSNGERCQHRRWLQIHHRTAIKHGGQNQLANLTILCSAHHRLIHQH